MTLRTKYRRATELLREVEDLVAKLVANLETIIRPDVAALGGTIRLHGMMLERAQAVTAPCTTPRCHRATSVATAKLGGDVRLLGAAHQVFAAH
ncbi:MAG: ROK family protein [Chloroflexota bacterium]|nr:ROK family protein [Chloroflexota bacterium]